MFKRILLLFLFGFLTFSCSNTSKILSGSDKELYENIQSELAKKKTLYVFGGPRFSILKDYILTLQIRYPYSVYTREVSLIQGDISFKTKKFAEAIENYKIFIDEQLNHPKVNYAKYKIIKSYKELMSSEDKDIGPTIEIIKIYNNLDENLNDSEYIKEIQSIYEEARILLLKRTIYIANFYMDKNLGKYSFESAYKRIVESSELIQDLIESSAEAQYIKLYSLFMIDPKADKVLLINNFASSFPNDDDYIESLNSLLDIK